jgi:CheY-like chemotaxis protein
VLRIARDFVPDVALLDIGLPVMDGYELARRLRALPAWRHVKLLALTGYGQSSDRARSVDVGFDHHLVKPIDLATLERYLPSPAG